MAKARKQYICNACGCVQSRWMGKCPDCGTWDALEQFDEPKVDHRDGPGGWTSESDGAGGPPAATAVPLPQIEATESARLATGIGEFDRVLGGGFVPGSVVLIGGDPGIGKSTLLLEAAARLARSDHRVLYVTSEESAYQTRLRSERLFEDDADALGGLYVLADTHLGRILEQAAKIQPALIVIDSIQMVYKGELEAGPGSVGQLRGCCMDLVGLAKRTGVAITLVGHVTKEGSLAGPRLLEHLVDAVLAFEGDRHHAYRIIRGIKNRYGTTLEVGLFQMTGKGLREVDDAFERLDPGITPLPGSVVCPVRLGSRTSMIEIQALTAPGLPGAAKRRTSGLDPARLAMLIAVLEQHGGLRLGDQDVFVSVVGGLRITEPAADLAMCLAIAGSYLRRALPAGMAVVGEVGLGGEIRMVHQLEARAREAQRLGYRTLLAGGGDVPARQLQQASRIAEAIAVLDAPTRPSPRPVTMPRSKKVVDAG